jgi:hypothetical protein
MTANRSVSVPGTAAVGIGAEHTAQEPRISRNVIWLMPYAFCLLKDHVQYRKKVNIYLDLHQRVNRNTHIYIYIYIFI